MTSSLITERADEILRFYKNEIANKNSEAYATESYLDTSNDLFGFNGSNIILDRYETLFQKYQLEMGKSRNVIESFDVWLDDRLPEQIMNNKIEDPERDSIITLENVRFYKPYRVGVSNGKTYEGLPQKSDIIPMYPRDALIRQETYSSEIKVDIYSRQKKGDGDFSRQLLKADVTFGKIPIIKGCKYCWLRGMTDAEKVAVGECFNDPLGYYVIGGMEKVMVAKENIKASQMVVARWDKKKPFNGILMYSLTTTSSIKISLNVDHRNDNLIEVVFHEKPPTPVFILSLFLQFLFDEELVQKSTTYAGLMKTCRTVLERVIIPEVMEFVPKDEIRRVRSRLLSTITNSMSIIEKNIVSYIDENFKGESEDNIVIDPVAILSKHLDRVKRESNSKRGVKPQFTSFIKEVKMNVFPTSIDDSVTNEIDNEDTDTSDFDRRRRMLSKMVATYARHLEGLRPEDDRDSYIVKRIETTARQMETHFNSIFKPMLKDFKISSLKLDSDVFTSRFENRLRSGIKQAKKRENVSEPIQRITPASIYSQLQRVTIKSDSNSKVESTRTIHPTQTGYICTGETPEGENCGVLKNLTTICWVSIPRNSDLVDDMIQPYIVDEKKDEDHIPLLLNGDLRGWINNREYINLKHDIKRNLQTYDVSVYLNHADHQVDIFTTGSLPTRPLLVVNPESRLLALDSLTDEEIAGASIMDLVEGGFIEFNSPSEVDSRYPTNGMDELWQTLNKGHTYIKIAEYPKDVSTLVNDHNQKKRLDEQPFTHSELVPHAQFGYSASCVPKANTNKGPRVTFQCSMFKHALAGYHSVHNDRYDSGFKIQQFPSRTAFETSTHEPIGLNAMPATASPILAVIVKPMNNEDAIVAKREFLDNNLRFVSYSTNTISIRENEKIDIRPENEADPSLHALYKASDNVSPDLIGFPRIGTFVNKGDAILGKYNIKLNPETGKTLYIPSHATIGLGKDGFVMGVEVVRGKQTSKVVRIKIAQYRRQVSGDKLASRYAQKGTLGEIVAEKDMPRIVGGPNDGVVPDMCFNTHSIPSRQTQGKIIEILASTSFLHSGQRVNGSPFGEYENDNYMEDIQAVLERNGLSPVGEETMRHPNGTLLKAKIYIGVCAYQMLKHHVADKFQVRDTGRLDPITHQPVRGRFNEGGIRMGEMERDSQISHGTSEVVQRRMMMDSDPYRLVCCVKCGNIAQSNFEPRETTCTFCPDSTEFGVLNLPYSTHHIFRMLNGAGVHTHFKFAKELVDTRVRN